MNKDERVRHTLDYMLEKYDKVDVRTDMNKYWRYVVMLDNIEDRKWYVKQYIKRCGNGI